MKPTMTTMEKYSMARKACSGRMMELREMETFLRLNITYTDDYVSASKTLPNGSVMCIELYSENGGDVYESKLAAILEAAAIIGRDFTFTAPITTEGGV